MNHNPTRRSLLGAAPALLAQAPSRPIAVGFLGVGHPHGIAKLQTVRASASWRVAGVVESDPKLREQVAALGSPLIDRDALLADPAVEVIAVESDVRDHARDGLAAIAAGKHLHLEKSPATNLREFRAILDAARSRGRLVQVGYMWRYHPGAVRAFEAARNGWLGEIYMVKGAISNQSAPELRAALAEFSGGILFDLGGHVLDPLVRLLGRPKRVTPHLRTDGRFGDKFSDNAIAIFEWDRAIGSVEVTALRPGSGRYRSIKFWGSNGCALLNPIEPPVLRLDLVKAAGPYAAGMQNIPLPPYKRYVDDFVELAAAVRGEGRLRTSFEEDLLVQEALLLASGMPL